MKVLFIYLILLIIPVILVSQTWDNVIENIDTTGTINLTNSSWNNTLIKNCVIHNTGAGNDGIFLRDVTNVRIENCTIYNIDGQGGIRMSISGNGTDRVQIVNNKIYDVQENGINAPQRSQNSPPLNQRNLEIIGNTIYNTGLGSENGKSHSIYCQAADFLIKDNLIFGKRDGNGISVRSSGIISGNIISGDSKANKPSIRYFSDHYTGTSDTLLIENNIIYNDSTDAHVIDIFEHSDLYQNSVSDLHIVKNFNIRFNTAISFIQNKYALRISEDYYTNSFWLSVTGNILTNITSTNSCISVPINTVQISNYLSNNLGYFKTTTQSYDFHITAKHGAYNYVGASISDFPKTDIDGEVRKSGTLDAGADEYYPTTGILNVLKQNKKFKVYPNPIANGNILEIKATEEIRSIIIINSKGQFIYQANFKENSNYTAIEISNIGIGNGIFYILINYMETVPIIIN